MTKENNLIDQIKKNAALGYSLIRTLNFSLQAKTLPLISKYVAQTDETENLKEHLKSARPKIEKLLNNDVENMQLGFYPYSVLKPENILTHAARIPFVYIDAVQSALRKKNKQSKVFGRDKSDLLLKLPEYYRRNFHFQTEGYLGETSAALYEHQVEMLFSGSSNAMRRLIIPLFKKQFKSSNGEGLHFLEIGSGTGILTRFMSLAFPEAKITCVDLSSAYLKQASQKLKNFDQINYIQGPGENLNFKNETFDGVYSCFLFHELPRKIRSEMITESKRVLKKSGLLGLVDSLQLNDDPEFNWALEKFPIDFHEPFFKDYVNNPLELEFKTQGFKKIQTDIGFLSKAIIGVK